MDLLNEVREIFDMSRHETINMKLKCARIFKVCNFSIRINIRSRCGINSTTIIVTDSTCSYFIGLIGTAFDCSHFSIRIDMGRCWRENWSSSITIRRWTKCWARCSSVEKSVAPSESGEISNVLWVLWVLTTLVSLLELLNELKRSL